MINKLLRKKKRDDTEALLAAARLEHAEPDPDSGGEGADGEGDKGQEEEHNEPLL